MKHAQQSYHSSKPRPFNGCWMLDVALSTDRGFILVNISFVTVTALRYDETVVQYIAYCIILLRLEGEGMKNIFMTNSVSGWVVCLLTLCIYTLSVIPTKPRGYTVYFASGS